MPDGKDDKVKSIQELTGLPAPLFNPLPSQGAPVAQPDPASPAPQLPDEYFTLRKRAEEQRQQFQQQVNAAIKYKGALETQAHAYFGDMKVGQQDIDAYMQHLHEVNVSEQRKRDDQTTKAFNDRYGDANYRNSFIELGKYRPQLEMERFIKPDNPNPYAGGLEPSRYTDKQWATLKKRGTGENRTAPVDYDEALDKDGNITVDFFRKLHDTAVKEKRDGQTDLNLQDRMKELFSDYMSGKRDQFNAPDRPSVAQAETQARMNDLYDNLNVPEYYLSRLAQGAMSGLHSTGNMLVNGLTSDAGNYVAAQQRFERTNPSMTAQDEGKNWYDLDHIASSGMHMAGEFAPALFLGGEGAGGIAPALEKRLATAGLKDGLQGMAARFGARAIGDSFTGRLLQNSLHMTKTAFPQIFSGYVEDGIAKGFTPEQALARAYPRALINTLAMSVPGAVARGAMSPGALPGKILGSAAEQSTMRNLLGNAAQFIQAPASGAASFAAGSLVDSYQNYLEDRRDGRYGVTPDAGFVDYQNFIQAHREGSIDPRMDFNTFRQSPEAQQFSFGHAFKDAAEQGMFGLIWGTMEKSVHGHGILPTPVQGDYLAMAANDPKSFYEALDKNVQRGKMKPEQAAAMKSFVGRIAPVMQEAVQAGWQPREAARYAVEGKRLEETAKALQALTDQGKKGFRIDAGGKKIPVLLGKDADGNYTEEAGKPLQQQIDQLKSAAARSAAAIQQLREGTYLKGCTISGQEMMQMAAKYSPGDGLRVGQARRIIDEGPYTSRNEDILHFSQDPVVAAYLDQLRNPGLMHPAGDAETGIPVRTEAGDIRDFKPQNTNPVVLDANGNILDGKKRVAYALYHGTTDLPLARPLKLDEVAKMVRDETRQDTSGSIDKPATDGLSDEHKAILLGARDRFDAEMKVKRKPTETEKAAGVTNQQTRALYVAAEHLLDNNVLPSDAKDLMRRLSGGVLSDPMAEAFINTIKRDREAGKTSPVVAATAAAPGAPVSAAGTPVDHDEVLAASPFWDADKKELKDGFQPGQPGFEEVQHWIDDHQNREEVKADGEPVAAVDNAPVEETPVPKTKIEPGYIPIGDIRSDRFYEGPHDHAEADRLADSYDEDRFDPIHVWVDPDTGQQQLISGRTRVEAARSLGIHHVKGVLHTDMDVTTARGYAEAAKTFGRQVLADRPVRYLTSDGKIAVYHDGKELHAVNIASGKEAVGKYRKAAIAEAAKAYRFAEGVSAGLPPDDLSSEVEYGHWILAQSRNPAEVAGAWLMQEGEAPQTNYIREVIANNLGRITLDSYFREGDRNTLKGQPQIIANYLRRQRSADVVPIDVRADELSNIAGKTITVGDIIDFIHDFPNGHDSFFAKAESPLGKELGAAFERLTGFPLNEEIADIAVNQTRQGLSPAEQDIINQEFESYEQLDQRYNDAVARGEIDPGAEDRTPAVPEGTGPQPEPEAEAAGSSAERLGARRFGQLSVLASKDIIDQAGWHAGGYGGYKALHQQLKNMFGRQMGLVLMDNQQAFEARKAKGQELLDPSLAPNAWVDGERETIYLNVEKCPPSAVLDEMGHVWLAWAEDRAPELYSKADELADTSVEYNYMMDYSYGDNPALPQGMSAAEADRLRQYVDAYGTEEMGRKLLREEVMTQAIQKQGKMLAPSEDKAPEREGDGKVKKGNWGKWLEGFWKAIKTLADDLDRGVGFKAYNTRTFSKITLAEFSRAVAEELGTGANLSRKVKEFVDEDAKKRAAKGEKKANEVDSEIADLIAQKAEGRAGGGGEVVDNNSPEAPHVGRDDRWDNFASNLVSGINGVDLLDKIRASDPELERKLLEAAAGSSHYQRLGMISDPEQRAEATLLDLLEDPHLVATAADKRLLGGLDAGDKYDVTGLLGEAYGQVVDEILKTFPEAKITNLSIAQHFARKAASERERLKLPDWAPTPKEQAAPPPTPKEQQPAAEQPKKVVPANKISDARAAKAKALGDAFSLPTPPAEDAEKEMKRHLLAKDFVSDSIAEGSHSLEAVLTDLYSLYGDKTDTMFPYVKAAYLAYGAEAPDDMVDLMDDRKTVRNFDYQTFKSVINAPGTTHGLEPDSPRGGSEDGLGTQNDDAALGQGAVGNAGSRGEQAPGATPEAQPEGDHGVPDLPSPAAGERGDQQLPGQQPGDGELPGSPAGDQQHGGSGWYGHKGQVADGDRRRPAADFVSPDRAQPRYRDKLIAQVAAENIPVHIGDRANIAETLPYLQPSQHDDVAFAERRLAKADGYGVLFANGTGTGKTFLGMGALKRMVRSGKTEGTIVVPNAEVMREWVDSAPFLGLTITPLRDLRDPGNGIAITTYANFGQNDALARRPHDFVVLDEVHSAMQNSAGDTTLALNALRAVTLHPRGVQALAERQHRDLFDRMELLDAKMWGDNPTITEEETKELEGLREEWNRIIARTRAHINANQGEARPRALLLSATPFAYRENTRWAEGYLFEYPKVPETGAYNQPGPYESFMIRHFGYRMRYNKLTKPDSDVDTDFMEREFNNHLQTQGVMSNRMLNLESDYQRSFALTPNAVGSKIDEGLEYLRNAHDGFYSPLHDVIRKRFDYLQRARLLEAIKAKEAIPLIQKLHAQGKKVVVFYQYNEGGGFAPFKLSPEEQFGMVAVKDPVSGDIRAMSLREMYARFERERPELAQIDFANFGPPLETLRAAFPNAAVINGREARGKRSMAIKDFNDDSKPDSNLVIVQASVAAGWSGHDQTGKSARTMINLGLPTAPTQAIQQEGRIYRFGQHPDSHSHFVYMNTGTTWERIAYATKIAERAGTAENLAMGRAARALKQSFIDSFENSAPWTPGPGDGRGSRDADRRAMAEVSDFDKAKSYYFGRLKKTAATKGKEGVDYYATPEPLGYKMVEWGAPRRGEHTLEPSAGHGAISRWLPDYTHRTLIEPSTDLYSEAALSSLGAKALQETFEDHYIGNKYDVIAMNPPYGHGGKMAMDHLAKAAGHLKPGGRIVALVPVGEFNKRFDKWMYEEDARGRQVRPDLAITARITLPSVTFKRAGTEVNTQIIILDKALDPKDTHASVTRDIDLTRFTDIKDLFEAIQHMDMPARVDKPLGAEDEDAAAAPEQAAAPSPMAALATPAGRSAQLPVKAKEPPVKAPVKNFHTKNQKDIWVVQTSGRMPREDYDAINKAAKAAGGFYSLYKSNGAIPGFIFPDEASANKFYHEQIGAAPAPEADQVQEPGASFFNLPPNATNEQKELHRQWEAAGAEVQAARNALSAKRKELDRGIMDDGANLFGERRSDQGSQLFNERVDPNARGAALEPLQARLDKATAEQQRLSDKLKGEMGRGSGQLEAFSLPYAEQQVVDEARKAADDGQPKGFNERMEALSRENTAESLAARGDAFSLPLSLPGRAKQVVAAHKRYFLKEDHWLGSKDLATMHANTIARNLQEEIQRSIGDKPNALLHPIRRQEWRDQWRNIDKAIHIYLDTEANPTHLADFQAAVVKAHKDLADPAASINDKEIARNVLAQEKVVELSQNLTPQQQAIAADISAKYKDIGKMALDAGVIRDVIDNYVARAWDFPPATEERFRFSTFTRHSLQRTLDTILEGYMKGYKLKVEGATNNLSTLYQEISNVIENNRLLDEGLALKDDKGNALFTTSKTWAQANDYVLVNNKAFRKWTYAGKLSDLSHPDRQFIGRDIMVTPKGQVIRKMDVYAPPEIARGLNNILGHTKLDGKLVQGVTAFNAAVKQSILSYSGFHWIAFTRAHTLTANMIGEGKVNPLSAYKAGIGMIAREDAYLKQLVYNGMTLNRQQDFQEGLVRHNTWLGGQIDKIGGVTAKVKNKILDLNHEFHRNLFETYGAGLKAFDGIMMLKSELRRDPNADPNEVAQRVAKAMNDTYGGLNWNRMRGSALQNPTTRHAMSLLLLAPDWTTSNIRFAKKAFEIGDEGTIYRRMWAKVLLRGAMLTAAANAALAMADDDGTSGDWTENFGNRYNKAWKAGHLRWLAVDITPLYHFIGGAADRRAYFSVFGAYTDPLKMMDFSRNKKGDLEWHIQDFLEAKSAVVTKMGVEAITGQNWQHKNFTTLDEFLGLDDKGVYKYEQAAHHRGDLKEDGTPYLKTTKGHHEGEAKGGKDKWSLSKYDQPGSNKAVFSRLSTLPSFIGSQVRGLMPTSLQSLAAAWAGENDWAQFSMQAPGTGVVTSKDPDKE